MLYTLRKCLISDFNFLFDLKKQNFQKYVDTYWKWDDEEQKEKLRIDLEEHLSHKHIILMNNKEIGVYVFHITEKGDCFLNELSLLNEYQGKRIGTDILKNQLKENEEKKIRTILQVFKNNPAKKLYERLGFTVFGETETHYQMEKK